MNAPDHPFSFIHPFIHESIHPFDSYLLSTCYTLGAIAGAKDTAGAKTQSLPSGGLHPVGRTYTI